MRTFDEILSLARELSASERTKLLEALERLERQEAMAHDDQLKAWRDWVEHGPQGPIEDDETAWP